MASVCTIDFISVFVIEVVGAGKEEGPFKVGEFGREGVGRLEGASAGALRIALLASLRTLGTFLRRIVTRWLEQRHLLIKPIETV